MRTHMHRMHTGDKTNRPAISEKTSLAASSFSLIHSMCSQCNQYIAEAAAMRTNMHRMHTGEKLLDQLKN